MKFKITLLFTIVSLSCFSQTIGNFKIANAITKNPLKVQFSVFKADTVFMNLYDTWGNVVLHIVPKDLYGVGNCSVEYTISQTYKTDTYIYQLKSSDNHLYGNILFLDFISSGKTSDFVKITYIDSIKVFDTTKFTAFDTTKVLIIDTLNCVKTAINAVDYKSIPISGNMLFHDNVSIPESNVHSLVIFDMSGKFIRKVAISNTSINLQDLSVGVYIGLFYRDEEIVKVVKMIKE